MIEEYTIKSPSKFETFDYNAHKVSRRECHHEFVLTRLKASNGTFQYRTRCAICGKSASNAIKHTDLTDTQKTTAVDWDYTVADRWERETEELWRRDYETMNKSRIDSESRPSDKWWQWYAQYLQSGCWHRKRAAVLRRAQGICEACGVKRATQVHHLTYDHVGREPLFDLVAVCDECHNQITYWSRTK